jgi:hypothetical protein
MMSDNNIESAPQAGELFKAFRLDDDLPAFFRFDLKELCFINRDDEEDTYWIDREGYPKMSEEYVRWESIK